MNTLYLWVDLLSLIPPLVFSFHGRSKFYQHWPQAIPAILITALIFVVWDMYYTQLGVWGFNSNYLIGLNVRNLPIEEILFFICIPYACLFSYHSIEILLPKDYLHKHVRKISIVIILICVTMASIFYGNLYTVAAFGLLSIVIFILQFVLKVNWLSRFYFSYLFLMIPFLIVNGILTGTGLKEPIVWYNPDEFIGIRILTIPFEDIFYGMSMLLFSMTIYKYLLAKKRKHIE